MLINKSNTKFCAVSKVNAEIIDFAKPFVAFLKLPKISYSFIVDEDDVKLFHTPIGHEEAFIENAYTPFQNIVFELQFIDNKLVYHNPEANYHKTPGLTHLLGETQEDFLNNLTKIIHNQLNGISNYCNREAIVLNFMSLDTFQELLNFPSAVMDSYFNGTMVENFKQFYPAQLLQCARKIYSCFEKQLTSHKNPDEKSFTLQIFQKSLYTTHFKGNNYYKTSNQDMTYLIFKELMSTMEKNYQGVKSRNELLLEIKENLMNIITQALDGRYKMFAYIPYFENNNTPFGCDFLPFNVAVNKKQLMQEIYSNHKAKQEKFPYCDRITHSLNDLRKFNIQFVKQHIQGA